MVRPVSWLWLCLAGGVAQVTPLQSAVEFNRDIRPLLSDRCFACHGPDGANRKAGLRLDQELEAKAKLRNKYPIVPGDPSQSEVYLRITSKNPALRMPPAYLGHAALSQNEIALIRQWIEEGAHWQKHWSFIPVVRPAVPPLEGWGNNPVDAFVAARLRQEGLRPSPEAPKPALLRRVTLDLTGLPPTPEETKAFLEDRLAGAYERVVDRLLASPRYAERMAIRWLEAARYADTNGYQSDGIRQMWRWRDWVIDAFHRNKPFDEFTVEQIAGDLLPNQTREQRIATGFHRNHRTNAEGGIVEEEFRTEYVADRVETTATVWLGLTLGCARCHDHKYDPLTQRDFYSLFAFFNNVPERGLVYNFGNEEPFIPAPLPEQEQRLAELTARLHQAERQWRALKPVVERQQRRWEKQSQPLADWQPGEDLVLHFPLEEATATGLVAGPGKLGKAVYFDGKAAIEAGFEVAKFDFKDPFTFSAWIKPEAPNGAILSRAEDFWEGEGYTWFLHEGKLRLHSTRRFTDISLRIETLEPLKLGEWQHVAISYDGYRKGAGVRMYVNGQSRELKILFDELTYPFGPKQPFRLGAGAGEKYRYRGWMDEVRIYRRALSAEEVAALSVPEPLGELLRLPKRVRSQLQEQKLRLAFLDLAAPQAVRQALRAVQAARREWRSFYDSIPTVMVMKESATPRETFILQRGAYDAPGERVSPAVPAVLGGWKQEWPKNRLGLARWLVDRSNPLTARVLVNRFWQMLFGTGLVKTSEDFGAQGEWPIHRDLLDWLAAEFMDSGWNVKAILRTIVLSATYRQDSKVTPELLQRDPENRLLARGPRLRLPAEMVRDQALAVSGLLVEQLGGPSVKPYQPPGLWQELSGGKYEEDQGPGLYRRSLYTFWRRTIAPPSMINFDSPTREVCTVRETRTNTPLQALNLMNEVTFVEAARKLAERMLKQGAQDPLAYGFELALGRQASPEELAVLKRLLERFRQRYQQDTKSAEKYLAVGASQRDPSLAPAELAAHASVASVLLNLDEFVTKE
ncbi:MAG: DUF1553 domain-containing protein [Bryobacteraceae bacterium]|nr:DUF1553 domain-containing protein [Bryobacteraceae bacterium]MDW8378201.1 DUF1553 domain-containing protein [Bryobacterales bacterium]